MKFLSLICLVLASCSSGVVQTGPGTYMMSGSKPGLIGAGAVKADLYAKAGDWCSQRGLAMVPLDSKGSDAVFGGNWANAEIHFRAVPPSEAGKYQSSAERQPDVVIEARDR